MPPSFIGLVGLRGNLKSTKVDLLPKHPEGIVSLVLIRKPSNVLYVTFSGKKKAKPVNKDRFISKMFLRFSDYSTSQCTVYCTQYTVHSTQYTVQ